MTGTVRLMAGEPVKTIDSRDGTTIAYQQTGNGPALATPSSTPTHFPH